MSINNTKSSTPEGLGAENVFLGSDHFISNMYYCQGFSLRKMESRSAFAGRDIFIFIIE